MGMSIALTEKSCVRCHKTKAINEFRPAATCQDGYRNICIACSKAGRRLCILCKVKKPSEELIYIGPKTAYCQACWQALQGKKKCIDCRQILDLQEFAADKSRPDGREYYCRSCRKEHQVTKHMKVLIQRGEKQCRSCKEFKALDEFFENHTTRDKIDLYCKQCRMKAKDEKKDQTRELIDIDKTKARRLQSLYGITWEEYKGLFKQQNGLCAICGRPEINSRKRLLCVDHDHITGKVRALLCGTCNTGLGAFEENPEYLLKAAQYLQQHSVPKDPA